MTELELSILRTREQAEQIARLERTIDKQNHAIKGLRSEVAKAFALEDGVARAMRCKSLATMRVALLHALRMPAKLEKRAWSAKKRKSQ